MPPQLRRGFGLICLAAALLICSLASLLVAIPAAWMVALFLDDDVDYDKKFVRNLIALAVAGTALSVAGAIEGGGPPLFYLGFLLGASPSIAATIALAGGVVGVEGAILTRAALAQSARGG